MVSQPVNELARKAFFRNFMPLNTIDRYIFRELMKVFLISVSALTAVLFVDKILLMSKIIINRGVSIIEMLEILIYLSPAFLSITIPMSVLVSSVVVFNQFSAYNELVAMKASNRSFLDLLKPVFYFSLMAYFLANLVMFYVLPWGNYSYKLLIFDIIKNRVNLDIQPNVFNKDFKGLTILIKDRKKDSRLEGIFISDKSDVENPKTITAREGVIFSDRKNLRIQLKLSMGTIHEIGKERGNYQTTNFDRYDLTLDLQDTERIEKKAMAGNRELSLAQLRNKIRKMEKKGLPTSGPIVEMSKKFSIPFTCIIFGFLGAPLGVKSSRSGRSGSFAMAILIILIYYVALVFTQNMGKIGKINPYLSVWIPNFLFTGTGIYVIYKMQKEIPFKFLDRLVGEIPTIFEKIKKLYYYIKPPADRTEPKAVKYQPDRDELSEFRRNILNK